MTLPESHTQRLRALIFDCNSGRIPDWLAQQAQACAKRYAGLRTTPEFEMALRGFSQRGSEPFELFVVGEGNFGKSTLINALVGEEIAKVHVLPETRTFHRLILARNPSKTARLLVHIETSQHEWLRKEIGSGKPAPGFFEVMEHSVPLDIARHLLAEENVRARKSKELYKPAILELEQEILWTPTNPFPERVRIVDTQGLNQQLPEDLQQSLKGGDQCTSDKVVSRLNQHVRGRHMLWQYRRCDAALWLLRANQIESAATDALFNVFSAYGKKTLLVITHIDVVSEDPRHVIERAGKIYHNRVDAVVPIDGRQALAGSLKRAKDRDAAKRLEDASGLSSLRAQIHELCVVRGLQTKAIGLYNSLRTTESDLRRALDRFLERLDAAISLLAEHRKAARQIATTSVSSLDQELSAAAGNARSQLDKNIRSIGFWNDGNEADEKIAFRQVCTSYQQEVNSALKRREGELHELVARLQKAPYTLPVFDPLGNQAGESVSVKAVVALKQRAISIKSLHVELNRSVLDALAEIFSIAIDWFCSSEEKARRRRRRQDKLENIYRDVHQQCDPGLNSLFFECEKEIKHEFRQGITGVESAIGRVEERLASVEREPLAQTRLRLETMLTERAMKSSLASCSVAAFKALALKHQFETLPRTCPN